MDYDLRLGRMRFITALDDLEEAFGSGSLEAIGTVVVPGERRARPQKLQLPIEGARSEQDQKAVGLRLRRQLRSLMGNSKALSEQLYLAVSFDSEYAGWIRVASGDLKGAGGGVSLGRFQLELGDAYKVATLRTHRPARVCRNRDRRLSTTPRDYLGGVYSTDFAGYTALALNILPVGASDVRGDARTVLSVTARSTLDGALGVVTGRADGEVVSYEQQESDHGKGDVVVYDRRGNTGVP